MMDKRSNEHLVCVKCGEDAVHGSDPPLCERHLAEASWQDKKASAVRVPETLKELEHA